MFYRFKPFSGPIQFEWKDPDTGRVFVEASKEALLHRIEAYRKQNNLEDIEAIDLVLESYWCGKPENRANCVGVPELKRGLLGYMKGGLALVKQVMYKQYAPQHEANRRAEICVGCPLNVFPDRQGFVKWSNDIAIAMTNGRKSVRHEELGECAGCGCPMRAKVFYVGDPGLTSDQIKTMKEANEECWQLPRNRVKRG